MVETEAVVMLASALEDMGIRTIKNTQMYWLEMDWI